MLIPFIPGKSSSGRRSLHDIGSVPNPYEQAISIIGRTPSDFDDCSLIPCFDFGDGQYVHRRYSSIYSSAGHVVM